MAMNQWFRLYAEFATDPKVQMLPETLQRRYVMLLCLRCQEQYETASAEQIAFMLRISLQEWQETRKVLIEQGLLVDNGDIHGWSKRQYVSDTKDATAALRQQRYRDKKRNARNEGRNEPVSSRLPEADTETEAEKDLPASSKEDALASKLASLAPCPHQDIIGLYAKHLPHLPYPRIWEGSRRNHLKARWRWALTARKPDGSPYATDAATALAFFDRFFAYVARSDFLTGRNGKWHGCDLGWLGKAANFAKVVSGNYEAREEA